jgi:hypothetical protein
MDGLPKTYIYLGLITTGMFGLTALIQQRTVFALYAAGSLVATLVFIGVSYFKNKKNNLE